jgi:hypothetical protein
MKKVMQFVALLAVTATLFSSCKTRTDCPAYGNLEDGKTPQEKTF